MPLDPVTHRRRAEELRALTGDANGAQRVAWTDTWEPARAWLREKVAVDRRARGDRRGRQPVVHAPGPLRARRADRRAHGLGAERRLARRLPQRASPASRCCDGSPRRATPPVTVRLVNWADEEGARFGRSLFGSSAAAGSMRDQDELRKLVDRDGIALPDALREHGVDLDRALDARAQLRRRRGLSRAAHRAGPGARVARPAARRRARHVRRRALTGSRGAARLRMPARRRWTSAATRSPARRSSRSRSASIAARGRRRRGVHVGRRASAGPGSSRRWSRRPSSCSTSAISTRPSSPRMLELAQEASRAVRRRGEHRGRVGADLEHRADPLRRAR